MHRSIDSRPWARRLTQAICSLTIHACLVAVCATTAGAADDAATADMKAARQKAAWRARPVVLNNDGNDAMAEDKPSRENFLRTRAVPMAKTKVKTLCYCNGVWGVFTHPSPVAELRDHRDFGRKEWSAHLADDGGPDTLGTMVDFCHKQGIEIFWSLRMNDTHDSSDLTMLSQWKKAHPEFLVGRRGVRYRSAGGRWSAADYAHAEVRDRVAVWIEDVLKRYDVDGVELDFFRHLVFFKPQLLGQPVTQEQCDLMTSLLRRIRTLADEAGTRRGRPMLITIRVPDSAGFCKAVGLDVDRWLAEGLVDILAVSGYFRLNPWRTSAEWGHRYNVPVFASLDEPRLRREPELQKLRESVECYRARALAAWREGVDGIYLFNYHGVDPKLPACNDVGEPDALVTMDKLYTTGAREVRSAGGYLVSARDFVGRPPILPEAPKTLSADKPVQVPLVVYDEVAANGGKPTLRLYLSAPTSPERLVVALDGRELTGGRQDGRWIEWAVEPSWVKTGTNRFDVSLKGPTPKKPLRLHDLLLWVRYPR